jgi:hypothetical protein
MKCKFIANTNKNESLLGKTILEEIAKGNEDYANELLYHFKTPYFINEVFGDYEKGFLESYEEDTTSMISRVDENGEPALFKNLTNDKFYYIDKNLNKVIFPFSEQGLSKYFTSTELREISSTLALQFYKETESQLENENFNVNLNNFLKEFITSKINEIYENKNSLNEDYSRAEKMERLLENSNELVTNVVNFFKRINFEITADEFLNEDLEVRDYNFSKESNEVNKALSIRPSIKLAISLLEDTSSKDKLFKLPRFLKFEATYSTLIKELGDVVPVIFKNPETDKFEIEDIFELYLDKIQELSKAKPEYKTLYLKMKSFTELQKNHFTKAFYMQNQDMIVTQVSSETKALYTDEEGKVVYGDTISFNSKNLKATDSLNQRVRLDWSSNFNKLFLDVDGKLIPNAEVILTEISNSLLEIRNSEEDIFKKSEILSNTLKYLGIEVSDKTLKNYLTNNKEVFTDNEVKIKIQGLYIALDNLKKGITKTKNFNDIFSKYFEFSELANLESFFREEKSDANVRVGKKARYTFSNMSYLKNKILSWKKNPSLLKEHLQQKNYYKGNVIGRYLLGLGEKISQIDKKARLDNLNLSTFLGLKYNETIETKDLPFKDYFVDYTNKLLKKGEIRTITPADKSLDYQISNGFFIKTMEQEISWETGNGELKLKEDVVKLFRMYFLSELNRINEAYDEIEAALKEDNLNNLVVHYHLKENKFEAFFSHYKETGEINKNLLGNAFKSQLFPNLSIGTENAKIYKIYNEETGRPNKNFLSIINWYDFNNQSNINLNIDSFIQDEISNLIKEQRQRFLKNEFFIVEEDGRYTNKLIDQDVYNEYLSEINEVSSESMIVKSEKVLNMIASDSIINGIIQNIEYSKLYVGDIAYYKNAIDFKKRIPASYTDGLQLRLQPGEEYFKAAIIQSIKIPSPYLNNLEEILGKDTANEIYGNINSADAQAWITPSRWKFLVERVGNWTLTHDSVYKKLNSSNKEIYTKEELKALASPLKGVYFEINEGVPTYLKYSQAVLSPNLIKGQKGLEKLFEKMSKENIDELITLDGIKVGAKNPSKIHENDGTIKEDFSLNPMMLKNTGWKLQQDLPTKGLKETDLGSQIQKNIFGGLIPHINDNTVLFDYKDTKLNASEIINEIVNNTENLSNEGLKRLRKKFKINAFGKIENISGFYESLIDELVKRGGNDNIIEALQKEVALIGIPQAQTKIINVFASIFLNNVVKIKTNGGSYVQMSNFGFSKDEAVKQGVIMSPKLKSGDTTYEPYFYIDENGEQKVSPAGIFISGSFISKYIPDYKKYTSEELFESYNGGDPILSKEILTNIIGYRIPNQGLPSNDSLEIIGILPEEQGDTIIAYTGITAKTGSDFDIDKMYLMLMSFKEESGKLIVDNSKDNKYKNNLIKLYKSVLTNTEVIKEVLKTIDDDLIKNEINDLTSTNTSTSLFHFDPFNDIKLKYDFIKGKAGVGQEANTMVDVNRPGQLSLIDYKIGWGHINENNETVLDNLYSEELSDSEIEDYMKLLKIKEENKERFKLKIKKIPLNTSITSVLNGFVDIAKDPFITRGNWTTATTNTGNLLLRAGVHPLKVVNFLAQPVITEYLELQSSKEGSFGDDTKDTMKVFLSNKFKDFTKNEEPILFNNRTLDLSDIFDKLIYTYPESLKDTLTILNSNNSLKKLARLFGVKDISKYIEILGQEEKTSEEQDFLDDNRSNYNILQDILNSLKTQVVNFMKVEDKQLIDMNLIDLRKQHSNPSIGTQLEILNKFKELQNISKNIRKVIQLMKVDTEGFGKDIMGVYKMLYLYDELIKKEENLEKGAVRGVKNRLQNSITGIYYDNIVSEVYNIIQNNPKIFPQSTNNVIEIFNNISQLIYGENLNNDNLTDKLQNSFYSFIMAEFFKQKSPLQNKEYVENLIKTFPNELKEFKRSNKGKYDIIDELKISDKRISMTSRNKSIEYQNDLVNSWKELLKDHPKLGKELIYYSFIKSSFQMKQDQFFTYIPHEYFVNEDINSFVENFSKNPKETLLPFIDKFFLNNTEDNTVVPLLQNSMYKEIDGQKNNFILLNKMDNLKPFVKISEEQYGMDGGLEIIYKVYKLDGIYNNPEFNVDFPVYTRVRRHNLINFEEAQDYLDINPKAPYNFDSTYLNNLKSKGYIKDHSLILLDTLDTLTFKDSDTISLEFVNTEEEILNYNIIKNNQRIGHIIASETSNGLIVDDITIYEKYRKKGYGLKALNELENLTQQTIYRTGQESELGKKLMDKFTNKNLLENSQRIWSEYRDILLETNPDIALNTIQEMILQMGEKEVLEYIKKCKQ